jgi:Cu(I)/Ag(I) efflux system membrane protein CusA/SilA
MRYGMNALQVIKGVKAKMAEIAHSLPAGVEIRAGYDRSGLIDASIHTLERDLIEEAIVVRPRDHPVPLARALGPDSDPHHPIAVVASFIPMYYLHVSSNIMSLGGLALAIGVLVDAGIVMVENGYRLLAERQAAGSDESPSRMPEQERRQILLSAARQVAPALFFSLMIRDIYHINRLMRRAGMGPLPPGMLSVSDRIKLRISRGMSKIRQMRRSADSAAPYPVGRSDGKLATACG